MKTLLIIDGNAILHRAFHALPPLTDKNGQIVNAVYGFFSMLLKLVSDIKPTHLIVCFDRPAPTFRKSLFAGYQAHRPEMTDDLSSQIIILHEALNKIGVQIFEFDGFEADDVIGTLANQSIQMNGSIRKNIQVKIVTGDRDLLQLVNENIHILFPGLGLSNLVEYDAQKVKEKFGIRPNQFIDYKALIGDTSDGYPGVNGIGPKTAGNLLREFNSFESLYENLNKISSKIAEKLITDVDQANLAKKLATIVTDIPITFHLADCLVERINKKNMEEVFDQLSFNSLKKRLEGVSIITSKNEKNHNKLGKQMSLL